MAKKAAGAPRDVREAAQKIWMAGLGALKVAEEEGSRLFKKLVEQGEHFEERSRESLGKLGDTARAAAGKVRDGADETFDRLGRSFDEKLADTLKKLGVPTRDEISSLSSRVEDLTRAVDRLRGGAEPAARKGGRKTSASAGTARGAKGAAATTPAGGAKAASGGAPKASRAKGAAGAKAPRAKATRKGAAGKSTKRPATAGGEGGGAATT